MSDKALVRQLPSELERFETEIRNFGYTPVTNESTAYLKDKELLIAKMEMVISELTRQRDLAQSKVQDLPQTREYELLNQKGHSIVEAATDESKPGDTKYGSEPVNQCSKIKRMNSHNLLQFARLLRITSCWTVALHDCCSAQPTSRNLDQILPKIVKSAAGESTRTRKISAEK